VSRVIFGFRPDVVEVFRQDERLFAF